MINIWEYIGAKNIRITTNKQAVFEGDVISVDDKEETYDEEDSITILDKSGKYVGLMQSEIFCIEKLQ